MEGIQVTTKPKSRLLAMKDRLRQRQKKAPAVETSVFYPDSVTPAPGTGNHGNSRHVRSHSEADVLDGPFSGQYPAEETNKDPAEDMNPRRDLKMSKSRSMDLQVERLRGDLEQAQSEAHSDRRSGRGIPRKLGSRIPPTSGLPKSRSGPSPVDINKPALGTIPKSGSDAAGHVEVTKNDGSGSSRHRYIRRVQYTSTQSKENRQPVGGGKAEPIPMAIQKKKLFIRKSDSVREGGKYASKPITGPERVEGDKVVRAGDSARYDTSSQTTISPRVIGYTEDRTHTEQGTLSHPGTVSQRPDFPDVNLRKREGSFDLADSLSARERRKVHQQRRQSRSLDNLTQLEQDTEQWIQEPRYPGGSDQTPQVIRKDRPDKASSEWGGYEPKAVAVMKGRPPHARSRTVELDDLHRHGDGDTHRLQGQYHYHSEDKLCSWQPAGNPDTDKLKAHTSAVNHVQIHPTRMSGSVDCIQELRTQLPVQGKLLYSSSSYTYMCAHQFTLALHFKTSLNHVDILAQKSNCSNSGN